jgi:hypothetical protein
MATAFNTIIADRQIHMTRIAPKEGKVIAMPKKSPELENDANKLRKIMVNAYRIGDTEYAERAKRRVWELNRLGDTELDRRFGEIIAAYESFLTERNDRTTRATRTWQKVRNKGVKQAIIEWVTLKQERQGFIDLVEAGYGDFTIEALVVSMSQEFDDYVVRAAYKRLRSAGVQVAAVH